MKNQANTSKMAAPVRENYSGLILRTVAFTMFAFFSVMSLLTAFVFTAFPETGYAFFADTSNLSAKLYYAERTYQRSYQIYDKMPDSAQKVAYFNSSVLFHHVNAIDSAILAFNHALDLRNDALVQNHADMVAHKSSRVLEKNKKEIAKLEKTLAYYAGRVERLIAIYLQDKSLTSSYTTQLNDRYRMLAQRSMHPQVTNYEALLYKTRTVALFYLGRRNSSSGTDNAETYAIFNFLTFLRSIYEPSDGVYYETLKPLRTIYDGLATANTYIDISLAEYINCLLTEIGYYYGLSTSPNNNPGIFQAELFKNIVEPSSPLKTDIEIHVDRLDRHLRVLLTSVSDTTTELLTALHLSRTMVLLTKTLYCVYVSYNVLARDKGGLVDNIWTDPYSIWSDRYANLMARYIALR